MGGERRQRELLDEVVGEIVAGAPEGWTRIEATFFEVGRLRSTRCVVHIGDEPYEGSLTIGFPPSAVELRDLMYVAGQGTWFSLTLTIRSEGGFESVFGYDERPPFRTMIADMVSEDLIMYPREVLPQWMLDEQAVAVAAEATGTDWVSASRPTFAHDLAQLRSNYEDAVDRETAHEMARGFVPEAPGYRYLRIAFAEREAFDPVVRYVEVDELGDEYRRVEAFPAGFMDCADSTFSGPITSLRLDPVLSLDDVWREPGVIGVQEISPASFQEEWIVVSGVE